MSTNKNTGTNQKNESTPRTYAIERTKNIDKNNIKTSLYFIYLSL